MKWLIPSGDSFTIYNVNPNNPNAIEIDSLPDGEGILKRREDGTFYYEPVEPPVDPNPTPEPEPEPIPPVETLEEKINNLFNMTEQNNLITVDAVLGVYEEVLALREEVATLKEITNNA